MPWLLLAPLVLLVASVAHPVYVERYVVFCAPALALLTAGGLVWLARVVGLSRPGGAGAGRRPVALLLAVMVSVVVAPQQQTRTAARARTTCAR